MYAVVRTGSKQIRVQPGDVVLVERLEGAPGDSVELREVLLLGGEEGSGIRIGTPVIQGAVVRATVQREAKGTKIHIFKYRRRKRYRLRKGHRQKYTQIHIDSIEV
jgi:large subunit ribosomal protein L21